MKKIGVQRIEHTVRDGQMPKDRTQRFNCVRERFRRY
jgi:hypothetical protein